MSVLVLADVDGGKLTAATARVVAAAAELGPVTLLVDTSAVDAARRIAGVSKVLSATLPQTAEALAPALAKLAEPFTHIIAAANAMGRDVRPPARGAARSDAGDRCHGHHWRPTGSSVRSMPAMPLKR